MGFKKSRKASLAVNIPDSARKEIQYLLFHDIVDKVERHKILLSFILNLDQILLKYVPDTNETMTLSCAKNVVKIGGSSDKRCITGTFAITMCREFPPLHLILKGKNV